MSLIYKLQGVHGVFYVNNIWIQPWANFAQYMDPTFSKSYKKHNFFFKFKPNHSKILTRVQRNICAGASVTPQHTIRACAKQRIESCQSVCVAHGLSSTMSNCMRTLAHFASSWPIQLDKV